MNETGSVVLCTSLCCLIAIVVFIITRVFSKRGTDSDYKRAERDCGRAADYNRELAEQERRAGEIIEESRAELKRTDELIREQAEDNRRAGENNRRAKDLIDRAKDILSSDSD